MDELGKLNTQADRELFENIRVLDHPVVGYMAVVDVNVSPGKMWSRVWAVGTPAGMAAISLDVFSAEVKLADFWGDKVNIPEEGVLAIAAGPTINETMRRFHQSRPEDRYPYGNYRNMRGVYRAMEFIDLDVRSTMKEKKLEGAVIWRPESRNPIDYLFSARADHDLFEERDGEPVLVVKP